MAVGLGQGQRQPERAGGQAHRPGHVAAGPEHGAGAHPAQDPACPARGPAGERQRPRRPYRVAPVQARHLQAVEGKAGAGHQLHLGPLAADELHPGAAPAQLVSDRERRHDVPRRTTGRYRDRRH